MDDRRFDALTRTIASQRSRRGVLRGTIGAALATVLGRDPVAAKPTKVTLCHAPGTPDQATIEVPEQAAAAHRRHGDTEGACPPGVCPTATVTTGPPARAEMIFRNTVSGITGIVVTRSENADTVVPPFNEGTTDPITISATKIDQTQVANIEIRYTTGAGDQHTCTFAF